MSGEVAASPLISSCERQPKNERGLGMRQVCMQTKPSIFLFRAKMRAEIDEFLLDTS